MKETAGIFLVSKNGTILVGHPTNHSENFFSVPKGGVNKDEKLIDAAIRETYEESNVDVSDFTVIHSLTPRTHKNNKKIFYPYILLETENSFIFDNFDIKCNSNVPDNEGGFPEMDGFKWLTFNDARLYLNETQISCIDEVEKIFIDSKKSWIIIKSNDNPTWGLY